MKNQAILFSAIMLIILLPAFYSCTISHQSKPAIANNNVLIEDTFQCPNILYDSLYPDKGNTIVFGDKVDFNKRGFTNPLFSVSDASILYYAGINFDSAYNGMINLNCSSCKVHTILSKNFEGHIIFSSEKRTESYNGKHLFINDLSKNTIQKIPSPFPWVYKFISSPDGNFLLTYNGHLLYRFNILTSKLDSILLPACTSKSYFLVGDWSKHGKIIFAEAPSYNQDSVFVNILDKTLKQTDKVSVAIGTPQKIISVDCLKFNPLDDNEFYYSYAYEGIFKMNVKTKQHTLIKQSCRYKSIRNFTVSPDGMGIVAEIIIQNYLPNSSSTSYSRLMYIDLRDNSTKLINPITSLK